MVAVPRGMLPQNRHAERAVLGGILLKQETLHDVRALLHAEDFYHPAHQLVFQAMLDVDAKNSAIDALTIAAELDRRELLSRVEGGEAFLVDLLNEVPTAENIEHYARIVRQRSTLRQLIHATREISAKAMGDHGDFEEFVADAVRKVGEIADGSSTTRILSMRDVVKDAMDTTEARQLGKILRVKTGFRDLDAKVVLERKDLVVIGGEASKGKTALVTQIGLQLAAGERDAVHFISIEMEPRQLVMRMLSAGAHVNLLAMRQERVLDTVAFMELTRAAGRLLLANMTFDSPSRPTVLDIRSSVRRAKREAERQGKRLLGFIVDYVQKIRWHEKKKPERHEQLAFAIEEIKEVCKDTDCVGFVLSALNRESRDDKGKTPNLARLKGTGQAEYEADHVWFVVHRKDDEKDIAIGKQRNGPTGRVTLIWNGKTSSYEDTPPDWFPRPHDEEDEG